MPFQDWKLSELKCDKDVRVFSCFCCGGGSTMGYKLAGFKVMGGVEIDPRVADVYINNHHPKHFYIESVVDFNKRTDIPSELVGIDILDGSPPCSSFSMAGSREEKWGVKKHFREGQQEQVLDELFFHFIDTANVLQPKVVVAENVKGMIVGNARAYCREIFKRFENLGYKCQLFLLNSALMGVPQTRERVFFIARKKSLRWPDLTMTFNETPILFREIREKNAPLEITPSAKTLWGARKFGDKSLADCCERLRGKKSFFNYNLIYPEKVLPTIPAGVCAVLYDEPRFLCDEEIRKASTFPSDYSCRNEDPSFLYGMSVPPRMMHRVAEKLWLQWFSKEGNNER